MKTFKTNSELETRRLGRKFAHLLRPELAVLLYGDLGTGKTVFVRGICEELGIKNVKSPSFTLINEYRPENNNYNNNLNFIIAHVDLYRLEGGGDVDALGLDEYLYSGAALIVEWPERWHHRPDNNYNYYNIYFEALSESERTLRFDFNF